MSRCGDSLVVGKDFLFFVGVCWGVGKFGQKVLDSCETEDGSNFFFEIRDG